MFCLETNEVWNIRHVLTLKTLIHIKEMDKISVNCTKGSQAELEHTNVMY